ncbi:protein NRT1/ PTR FAMILY 5.10-like isoform X1 [Salvia miltiorrhiza]|uniref:protein NRT1/ PTR FAMILY 5.10-like isoform X1 n=1 Tax=Salvia miltiorrhiza TaxID=226208 RepID=UPI0025AC0A94|nr:protein NRT1/ PTR FAMILY 5.10-like isoform X1 [Salvia miltiorrhiza]
MMTTEAATGDDSTPLLGDVVTGAVAFDGGPAHRSKSGSWKSASFIIGVEVAERFAYYGISSNLITYLTGPLGESTAAAAAAVNAWNGAAMLLPLLGAFVADSFLGRYRTIIIASLLYILGLGLLSLSAALHSSNSSPPLFEVAFFFFSIYLVAFAQGGHKPCVQALGADQFDEEDETELVAKSSFFNWWYFSMNAGICVAQLVLSYIQENLSWELGFGIPCIMMCFALVVYLLGSTTYRFRVRSSQKNPFVRISSALAAAAARAEPEDPEQSSGIEEAKELVRIAPIWASCLGYAVMFAQATTLFTKQGATMDRSLAFGLQIPSASLQCLTGLSIVAFIPVYDRILVPTARAMTKRSMGITTLERIGAGISLSIVFMVVAAIVERQRISVAIKHGLLDRPEATVPMSVWWLAPQYVLLGIADVFTMVGLQEFMYDQVPNDLKSLGSALYLSIFGVGSFISGFLISIIDSITSRADGIGWFSDNLNRAHLDYFYWLLVGITAATLLPYFYFANSYVYKI